MKKQPNLFHAVGMSRILTFFFFFLASLKLHGLNRTVIHWFENINMKLTCLGIRQHAAPLPLSAFISLAQGVHGPGCMVGTIWLDLGALKQGYSRWGRALNSFSVRDVRLGFPKCRACELRYLPMEEGALSELKISKIWGLWAENFKIWRLESQNLGKNWSCRGWNFQIFSKGGLVNEHFCLKWDPCELKARREGVLQGRTSPYLLSRSVPPPGAIQNSIGSCRQYFFRKYAPKVG